MTSFTLNGKKMEVTAEPDTPLLWVIRDEAGLTGTKFGCGIGMCGACTVHVGGKAAALVRDAGERSRGAGDHDHRGARSQRASIRCRRRGRSCRCRNAATASLARSCRPLPC